MKRLLKAASLCAVASSVVPRASFAQAVARPVVVPGTAFAAPAAVVALAPSASFMPALAPAASGVLAAAAPAPSAVPAAASSSRGEKTGASPSFPLTEAAAAAQASLGTGDVGGASEALSRLYGEGARPGAAAPAGPWSESPVREEIGHLFMDRFIGNLHDAALRLGLRLRIYPLSKGVFNDQIDIAVDGPADARGEFRRYERALAADGSRDLRYEAWRRTHSGIPPRALPKYFREEIGNAFMKRFVANLDDAALRLGLKMRVVVLQRGLFNQKIEIVADGPDGKVLEFGRYEKALTRDGSRGLSYSSWKKRLG